MNSVLLAIGFTVFFILALTFIYQEAHAQKWSYVCELTHREPYYDCPQWYDGVFDGSGDMWLVFELNELIFRGPQGIWVLGFAVFNQDPLKSIPEDDKYSLCNMFPEFNSTDISGTSHCTYEYFVIGSAKSDGCYSPLPCMNIFQHEKKHLQCLCDWHKDLKRTRTQ